MLARQYKRIRGERGVSTVALVLVLAFCVLLPLGLLSFEIVRYFLIQEELHNIMDGAALAGTAAMASAPSPPAINPNTNQPWTYADREYVAMCVAAETFGQNGIMQNLFNLASIPPASDGTQGYTANPGPTNVTATLNVIPPQPKSPALQNAVLNINPIDRSGAYIAIGNPAATIQVQAYYSDAPIFLGVATGWNNFVTMSPKYTIMAVSDGGLPSVDMLLCFDTSASMDDQTNAYFINRFWHYQNGTGSPAITGGFVDYLDYGYLYGNQNTSMFAPYGSNSNTTIWAQLQPPITGTGVNAFYPQNLSYASYPAVQGPYGQEGNNYPILFSETSATNNQADPYATQVYGLRSNKALYQSLLSQARGTYTNFTTTNMPEAGLPPGNYNPISNNTNSGSTYPPHQDMRQLWQWDGTAGGATNAYTGNVSGNGLDPYAGTPWNPNIQPGPTPPRANPSNLFTDLIVVPNAAASPGSYCFPFTVTSNGVSYTFANEFQELEASRGNCESAAALKQVLPYVGAANYTPFYCYQNGQRSATQIVTFTPQTGYFNAYWLFVLQNASPINAARPPLTTSLKPCTSALIAILDWTPLLVLQPLLVAATSTENQHQASW